MHLNGSFNGLSIIALFYLRVNTKSCDAKINYPSLNIDPESLRVSRVDRYS